MEVRTASEDGSHFLWDADRLPRARDHHFDPDWWSERDAVAGEAKGRGRALFLDTPDGAWVLRHYRRGGLLRGLLTDRYVMFGVGRSRAFREWRMLAELARLGLPAPEPVAARVVLSGLTYRADLITARVPDALTLVEMLSEQPLPAVRWQELGGLLARFHAAGVWHADLNGHNILIDRDGRFTLIDFDHSRLRRPGGWQARNLARLRRSLDKLSGERSVFHFADADWAALEGGYLQAR